jgi:hypothetical protein
MEKKLEKTCKNCKWFNKDGTLDSGIDGARYAGSWGWCKYEPFQNHPTIVESEWECKDSYGHPTTSGFQEKKNE